MEKTAATDQATGPTLVCPHCQETNVVAGWYSRDGQRSEGSKDEPVTCGFCAKKFMVAVNYEPQHDL